MSIETFFATPGIGGAMAFAVICFLVVCYSLTIRWIAKGQSDEPEEH